MTNKSDLFFIAFFDNSLTNYKHRLAPSISSDSLYRNGNYQFTIFVDKNKIYESNLFPGAPREINQDKDLFLNRPLIDNINGQGSWSESFWNRFLNNGGDITLTDGLHLLRMEIRPYVKTDSLKVGNIIASGELPIQVSRHPSIDITDIELNTVSPYDGFPVSNEKFDIYKIKELKGAIEEGIFKKVNSIIVIKKGQILIEEYFNGEDRNSLHDPRSVGKSFTSTLMGKAISDGYIKNENQKLKHFYNVRQFQNFSLDKKNAKIKELLTMSSGFDGDDEDYQSIGNEENMYPTSNWVKFALDLPYQENIKKIGIILRQA